MSVPPSSESGPRTSGEQTATMIALAFERLRRDLEAEGQYDAAAAVRKTTEWLTEALHAY